MASPSGSVNIAESTNSSANIDDVPQPQPPQPYPDRPRSTHHSYHAHHPPPLPHPLGPERKRSYGGTPTSPGHGGVDIVTDRDARQQQQHTESSRTGYGYELPLAHQHQQQSADGADSPDLQDADTPGSTDGGAAASKRRKTGRGSRGVAHLTPEQLERKRANDREAQRAIRERQRLKTEQYEREIAELKATQPYRELQSVVRQKEAVEAELADVKRRMAAIVGMIQPILGAPEGARMFYSPLLRPVHADTRHQHQPAGLMARATDLQNHIQHRRAITPRRPRQVPPPRRLWGHTADGRTVYPPSRPQ
jgi:hypothetical protein